MESRHCFLVYLAFSMCIILSSPIVIAQSPSNSSSILARQLDSLLQDYAYMAFVRPRLRTGVPYDGPVPSNLSGINVTAMRLRSGSLRRLGVHPYREFDIPNGLIVQPYVERLVLVYQNLGNWSSFYYSLQGYSFLTPVLGLLAYSAANLSATGLPELGVQVSEGPITIRFTDVLPAPSGVTPKCVWFDLNHSPQFSDLASRNVCSTHNQGHFSIVVESTAPAPAPVPAPAPIAPSPAHKRKHKSKAWKIAVAVVGGFILLVLIVMLLVWLTRYRQSKRMAEMERQADIGEALQMTSIGNTRAPVAMGTRTPPALENEYVP